MIQVHIFKQDTNIMGNFPLDVRHTIIAQMNRYFLTAQDVAPESLLSSPAHVQFSMEIIGQGCNLPLYLLSIMEDSVAVYQNWLMNPGVRPRAVGDLSIHSEFSQTFIQVVFRHLSLVFRTRYVGREMQNPASVKTKDNFEDYTILVNQHIELCKKISRFMIDFITVNTNNLSEETWVLILKVLFGICDQLLITPEKPLPAKITSTDQDSDVASFMADRLCEIMIQVTSF
jgi:hypothetical protein